jgi:hypothetical protein
MISSFPHQINLTFGRRAKRLSLLMPLRIGRGDYSLSLFMPKVKLRGLNVTTPSRRSRD